jgi:hypothetical protein
MKPPHRHLLVIDAVVILLLGVLLLLFPAGMMAWLSLPPINTYFQLKGKCDEVHCSLRQEVRSADLLCANRRQPEWDETGNRARIAA